MPSILAMSFVARGVRPGFAMHCCINHQTLIRSPCAGCGSACSRVSESLAAGEMTDMVRYLGVLCHWLEDVASIPPLTEHGATRHW